MVAVDPNARLRAQVVVVSILRLFGGKNGLTYEQIAKLSGMTDDEAASTVGGLVWDAVLELDPTGGFRAAKCRIRDARSFATKVRQTLLAH